MRENTNHRRIAALALCVMLFLSVFTLARQESQSKSSSSYPTPPARDYPKEIRGYKVELANVELKKQSGKGKDSTGGADAETLIQLGEPKVTSLSPVGIALEVPVTVAAVNQGGHVDFLTFDEMTVNGTPVTVNEYQHSFELPTREPITLPEPVSIYISTPRVLLGALGEWSQPKDVWPVTGRVYVFGRFKKFVFKFKRVVPVELNLAFRNPLKSKDKG